MMRVVPRRAAADSSPSARYGHVALHVRGADVLWHRNYVAIARAVRIERLIVHPDAPGEVVTLCSQYGVPVHVSQHGAIVIGDGAVSGTASTDAIVSRYTRRMRLSTTWSHRERHCSRTSPWWRWCGRLSSRRWRRFAVDTPDASG
ncbi:MAG: hypothetical protein KatS3mg038_3210 [Candidatus Kapaibacterium sp.]|nr:MAG: hypothetical protein KatS3mg038_3210 [Candidatus Kapabacteria bacterium]